jgi:hypothetical protein
LTVVGGALRSLLFRTSLILAIASSSCRAQNDLPLQKPLAEVDYRPAGKLIYVRAEVNGSEPLWFIFDSGAPNSLIDTTTAQRLNLKAMSSGTIRGAGKGEVSAGDAGQVVFAVGAKTTKVAHAKLVDLSKVQLPMKCEGLLGAEFLEQYVVRIDPVRHTLAFYDPDTFVYHGGGKSIPLELTNSRLYVRIGLSARPGELLERRLRVDTGSEDAIDDDTVRNSETIQKTTLGNGLGTSYEDVSGVYDTVAIGPYVFHHVWGPAGAVPIIGMEMMRRFTLTFDTHHGQLYLEPNASLSEPVPPPS